MHFIAVKIITHFDNTQTTKLRFTIRNSRAGFLLNRHKETGNLPL